MKIKPQATNSNVPILSLSEIEKPRSQAELRRWTEDLYEMFSRTSEGKRAIRFNKGNLVKQLTEELWPLSLFADAFYANRTDMLFQPVIGNDSYDALMVNRNHKVLGFLQITQAFDGYQEHLRMLHLEQYGRAPVTGPFLRKDRRTGLVPETATEAVRRDDLVSKTFGQILDSVKRKSTMRYEKRTSLIIEFLDLYIRKDEDMRLLDEFVRARVLKNAKNFEYLYLVAGRDGLAFQYKPGVRTYQPY